MNGDPNHNKTYFNNTFGHKVWNCFTEELVKRYEVCYKNLNLLRKGLMITSKFISISRFYNKKHVYLADFNVILAEDFSKIYAEISRNFNKINKI